MRICDLDPKEVVVGLRVRGLNNRERLGTIIKIDPKDDDTATIKWDTVVDGYEYSHFYGNNCECEVVK